MKWSQLKKRIQGKLADSVRNRIDFGMTRYANSYTMSRAWIRIDKQEIINMSTIDYECELYNRPPPLRYDYEESGKELNELNVFSSHNLSGSLFEYLNMPIDKILVSENPVIRAFGMLDNRLGKRRIRKINISKEHDLVKRLFSLRCDADGTTDSGRKQNLTSRINSSISRNRNVIEFDQEEIESKLGKDNKVRNLKSLISRIYDKSINENELETEISKVIFEGFREAKDSEILMESLLFLEAKTKLFDDAIYIKSFVDMAKGHVGWTRPLTEWKSKTYNRAKQFASLARHLWAQYDVPVFMDKAWLGGSSVQQQWYKDIGSGKNIRNSEDLPISMTKMIAHHFLLAPDNYSIEGAFRWGQVHALGGDKRLADALLETRIVEDFRDDDFWSTVIRFFVENPMLDTVHIGPIIDYIWNQKYEDRIVFVDRGVAQEVGPARPNFSMRGRTVESLLRAVNDWHRQLGKETKSGNLQWVASGVKDFCFIEGSKKTKNMKVWRIKELLNSQELISEGRQMSHCVATYAKSCHTGKCSIWSLSLETEEGMAKLLTIEVSNSNKAIKQIRGKRNRLATDNEKVIIRRWASREELELAEYLV